jgi:L-cystine uptake protein TcyP (sodium:dicarboxylate symporter family)
MLLMVVLLVSLIYIVRIIGKEGLSLRDRIFIRLPFSVYFGWITVATIANFTVRLVSFNWNGFGIAPAGWAVLSS